MNCFRACLFLLAFVAAGSARAQTDEKYTEVDDLSKDWLVYKGDSLIHWDGGAARVIYLNLDPARSTGKFVEIRSSREMSVFINQKLILEKENGVVRLNTDSLRRIFSPRLQLALFQKQGIDLRGSALMVPYVKNEATENAITRHHDNSFLNFSILATLILITSFIFLFRSNPRLTLDYLNVVKLFSMTEREDNLLTTRVTSSVNLLFYLFCSAFFALNLLTVFYFGSEQLGAQYFPVRSVAEGFLQWSKLMIIIAGCLFFKLALIYSFSTMFRLRDSAALQFFNFIRMIFFISIVVTLVSTACFIYYRYPAGPYSGLLKMTMFIMLASALMMFLKLLAQAPFRFFHLFSYLCASEIIPLMIFLKILL